MDPTGVSAEHFQEWCHLSTALSYTSFDQFKYYSRILNGSDAMVINYFENEDNSLISCGQITMLWFEL